MLRALPEQNKQGILVGARMKNRGVEFSLWVAYKSKQGRKLGKQLTWNQLSLLPFPTKLESNQYNMVESSVASLAAFFLDCWFSKLRFSFFVARDSLDLVILEHFGHCACLLHKRKAQMEITPGNHAPCTHSNYLTVDINLVNNKTQKEDEYDCIISLTLIVISLMLIVIATVMIVVILAVTL